MNNPLFSNITSDYYTRHYELDPQFTGGLQVIVYAECYPNTEGINGHYYGLDIYFSMDQIPVRDYIIGVSFGEGQMDKSHLDAEIDNWVNQFVSEDTFPEYLKDYMRKEKMWENVQNDKLLNGADGAE